MSAHATRCSSSAFAKCDRLAPRPPAPRRNRCHRHPGFAKMIGEPTEDLIVVRGLRSLSQLSLLIGVRDQRSPSREEAAPKRWPRSVVGPPMTLANMRAPSVRDRQLFRWVLYDPTLTSLLSIERGLTRSA